jgi:hypothetical protein
MKTATENINHLKSILNSKNHFNVRLGFTEVRLLETWIKNSFSLDYISYLLLNDSEKHWLSCAGIFPLEEKELINILTTYFNILDFANKENTENVSYSMTLQSDLFENFIFKDNEKTHMDYLNVCRFPETFQPALENKKICVVTPFPKSFESQLGNLSKLFEDGRLKNLDPNNVSFVKSPPQKFISTKQENPFNRWSDAVEYMKNEIDQKEYDVLLTGCGSFSLPLNHHAYVRGKTTLNMGGDLQLMFGVRGKRWKQEDYNFNEHWISPLPEEVPKENYKVEGGAYW